MSWEIYYKVGRVAKLKKKSQKCIIELIPITYTHIHANKISHCEKYLETARLNISFFVVESLKTTDIPIFVATSYKKSNRILHLFCNEQVWIPWAFYKTLKRQPFLRGVSVQWPSVTDRSPPKAMEVSEFQTERAAHKMQVKLICTDSRKHSVW